jgi:uncharacterized protein YdhG (YjbR/CyaY superfamily)
MTAAEVDAYLAGLDEPRRSTLEVVRAAILRAAPDAEEVISYGMPAAKVGGKAVAGFAAFKEHLAYLPHSSTVFPQLAERLAGYTFSKGSLHFPIDEPLPDDLVAELVAVRRAEASV